MPKLKTMKKVNFVILSLLLIAGTACNSSKVSSVSKNGESVDTAYGNQDVRTYTGNARSMKNERQIDGNIIDMLRRTPGLRVSGSDHNAQVTLVGTPATQMTVMSPLFVIDGMRLGHELGALVNAVNINDVARITVLKDPADTGIYGLDGTNGVIVVKTKKK